MSDPCVGNMGIVGEIQHFEILEVTSNRLKSLVR